jgi:hypothetical protein
MTWKEILQVLDDELKVAEDIDSKLIACYPDCTQEEALQALGLVHREGGITRRLRKIVDQLKKAR